jgi:hypothetical protein
MCKETGVKLDNEHWYKNTPKLVKSPEDKVTTLWNPQVQTDRTFLTINRTL